MIAIRMVEDAEGSPNGHTVYQYVAGEVYSPDSEPPADNFLMASFVASKRAVEVDANGNPVSTPASRRSTKAAATATPDATPETADSTETSDAATEQTPQE